MLPAHAHDLIEKTSKVCVVLIDGIVAGATFTEVKIDIFVSTIVLHLALRGLTAIITMSTV